MLLIAQPKSASTSLASTIAVIAKLNLKLGVPKKKGDKNCKGFSTIQRFHNNMIERSDIFLSQVIKGRKTIFKEHILPTDEHLKLLSKYKQNIIVLLRNPIDSFDAYSRLKIAPKNLNGVCKDLKDFHNRYMWWASRQRNVKIVYFEDLVLNYVATIKSILKHYGLAYDKVIPLMKKKYTGIGAKRVIDRTT